MRFELHARDGRARAGTLTTAHGEVATPQFMPVGTRATVRTQTGAQLERAGATMILANTYHLLIRPGRAHFEQTGGLHRWMRWPRPILTDSGGFQVFSLGATITDDGATLQVVRDGPRITLTPESSMAMQRAIGSDVMMVLDHVVRSTAEHAEATDAMARTHRWARRSLAARGDADQAVFAIVQGACFEDLRRTSAAELTAHAFDGFAIGGLAVGEERARREDTTELTAQLLPDDKPRYLMGVGTPLDLLEGVHRGVDLFDCILPTALAQQGMAFTSRGKLDLRRGIHKQAEHALDPACACDACTTASRSYLHHLIKCQEPLGWQLLATHNLTFYLSLMAEIRARITAGTFASFYAEQRELLPTGDRDNPAKAGRLRGR